MSQEIFRKLRQMLMEKLDVYRELTDQEILETIDELIVNTLRESGVSLKEKVQLRQELFYSVRKLDVLQELIEDETVTEIGIFLILLNCNKATSTYAPIPIANISG